MLRGIESGEIARLMGFTLTLGHLPFRWSEWGILTVLRDIIAERSVVKD